MYLFQTRTIEVASGETHPIFGRLRFTRGLTLLQNGGIYSEVDGPSDEQISMAEVTYLGGHTYLVTNDEAARLTTAGYGAFLEIAPDPDTPPDEGGDPDGFGEGGFGQGGFGQ